MQLEDKVVLLTGATGGLGQAFIGALLEGGVRKIYAACRTPAALPHHDARVVPLTLDITDNVAIATAVRMADDVSLLINNAGVNRTRGFLAPASVQAARLEMNVNYFGTLEMCRAFAPMLIARGGTIVNLLSILARITLPGMGSLCASKAAALRMTDGLRAELAPHGVRVLGVLPGAIDTEMSRDFPPPKMAPADVVAAILAALEADEDEITPGAMAQEVAAGLAADRTAIRRQFATYL